MTELHKGMIKKRRSEENSGSAKLFKKPPVFPNSQGECSFISTYVWCVRETILGSTCFDGSLHREKIEFD